VKKTFTPSAFLLFFLPLWCGLISPVQARLELSWYESARFTAADTDTDGYLNSGELRECPSEFIFFIHLDGFTFTDRDHNGRLDMQEWAGATQASARFREETERVSLVKISQEYPYFDQIRATYLRRHPDLAVRLFSNFKWASANHQMIRELLEDKAWWRSNPEVLKALHLNFAWLATFPDAAMALYRFDLPFGAPQALTRWRQAHTLWLARGGEALILPPSISSSEALASAQASRRLEEQVDSMRVVVQVMEQAINDLQGLTALLRDSLEQTRMVAQVAGKEDEASLAAKLAGAEKAIRALREDLRLSILEEDRLMAEMYLLKKRIDSDSLPAAALTETAPPQPVADPGEVDQLKAEIQRLNQELTIAAYAKAAFSSQTLEIQELKKQNEELTRQLAAQEPVVTDQNEPLIDNNEELTRLRTELASLQGLKAALVDTDEENARLRAELERLKAEQPELPSAEIQELKRQNEALSRQLAAQESVSRAQPSAASGGSEEVARLKAELESMQALRQALVETDEENARLHAELIQLREAQPAGPDPELARLRKELDDLRENQVRLVRLETENRRMLAERDSLQQVKSPSTQPPRALMDSLASARVMIRQLEQRVAVWEADKKARMEAEQRAQKAESRLTQVQKSESSLSQMEDSLSRQLADALSRNKRLEFIIRQAREELEEYRNAPRQAVVAVTPEPGTTERLAQYEAQQQANSAQLKNTQLYLAQVVAEKKRLENELSSLTAQQQRVSFSSDSSQRNYQAAQQKIRSLQDSLQITRSAFRQQRDLAASYQQRYQSAITNRSLNVDSLKVVILTLEKQLSEARSVERVERQRTAQLEQREAELVRKTAEITARERQLSAREATLAQQTQALDERARKYQDLEAKEKELKLLEQRVKGQ
jgi:chromosome segregation ATPase